MDPIARRRGRSSSDGTTAKRAGATPTEPLAAEKRGGAGAAETAPAAAPPAQGLNVTVAFIFCVTLLWLTGLIVWRFPVAQ